jgi:DNA-binding CsgD family transcriptional regulator
MQDDLIGAIYDAPLATHPWAALAGRLRRDLDCSGAMLKFARSRARDGRTRFVFDTAWDARESWRLYDSIYRHIDPTCHRPMAIGAVYDFDQVMPPAPDTESERYLGFCRSIGAAYALFAFLGEYRGVGAWLSISRDTARGRFDDRDAARVTALLPHLGRAVDIHARLEAERNAAAVHAAALADLGVGVILLDDAGAIIGANRLADALLDRGTAIARDRDRLKVRGASAAQLRRSLAGRGDGQVIVAGEEAGEPLHLLARPWSEGQGDGAGPAYVVYLDSPADQAAPRIDALRRRFGFSHAEARMAALLAAGRSLTEAGALMGLTPASARTYGKRVLARTGAARQADLVRMVLTSLARLDRPERP